MEEEYLRLFVWLSYRNMACIAWSRRCSIFVSRGAARDIHDNLGKVVLEIEVVAWRAVLPGFAFTAASLNDGRLPIR